jgi:8-oxo-dGTP pyrophosphatase MutT (NUDIX family)
MIRSLLRLKRLRNRATAVVIRNGRVLLVKDRGQSHFSLPGGGIKRNETAVTAASRELYEELGLEAVKIVRSPEYDFNGSLNQHSVCLVEAIGDPVIKQITVSGYMWWDMEESVPVLPHVVRILGKIGYVI